MEDLLDHKGSFPKVNSISLLNYLEYYTSLPRDLQEKVQNMKNYYDNGNLENVRIIPRPLNISSKHLDFQTAYK